MTTDDLVQRLRDEAMALSSRAWGKTDGGHRECMSAILADEAADKLSAQEEEIARLRSELETTLEWINRLPVPTPGAARNGIRIHAALSGKEPPR